VFFISCGDDGIPPVVPSEPDPTEMEMEMESETETENENTQDQTDTSETENSDTDNSDTDNNESENNDTDNSDNENQESDSTDSDTNDNESQDAENDGTEQESEFDQAPAFTISTPEGQEINSEDYEGQVLVIFFFGNGCPPCIGIGPDVEARLHQDFSSVEDYNIIGIDQWDGNDASVRGFRVRTGVEFPLGVKGSGVAKEFQTTYDRLVVINRKNEVIYRGNSLVSNNIDEVVDLVKGLLE